MAVFAQGDVVVVPFPFGEEEDAGKIRPALVLMAVNADYPTPESSQRLILCQITSHPARNADELPLLPSDFQWGRLKHESTIRPTVLWTVKSRAARCVGRLHPAKFREVADLIHQILTR